MNCVSVATAVAVIAAGPSASVLRMGVCVSGWHGVVLYVSLLTFFSLSVHYERLELCHLPIKYVRWLCATVSISRRRHHQSSIFNATINGTSVCHISFGRTSNEKQIRGRHKGGNERERERAFRRCY